jgi:hypothetical protein
MNDERYEKVKKIDLHEREHGERRYSTIKIQNGPLDKN